MLSNNPELNALWERVKGLTKNLAPEKIRNLERDSTISFVYGNLKLSGWTGTMEDVEEEYERLYGQR